MRLALIIIDCAWKSEVMGNIFDSFDGAVDEGLWSVEWVIFHICVATTWSEILVGLSHGGGFRRGKAARWWGGVRIVVQVMGRTTIERQKGGDYQNTWTVHGRNCRIVQDLGKGLERHTNETCAFKAFLGNEANDVEAIAVASLVSYYGPEMQMKSLQLQASALLSTANRGSTIAPSFVVLGKTNGFRPLN